MMCCLLNLIVCVFGLIKYEFKVFTFSEEREKNGYILNILVKVLTILQQCNESGFCKG